MNLSRSEKARLGAFVLSGLVILGGAIVSLAGLKLWERRDIYTVRFTEDIGGLERSASVRYHGLRIGRVESMRIAGDDASAIEVTLALDPSTVLYEGTRAVLDSSGLTGLKTINLAGGDPRSARLPPGSRLIPGQSLVDRITGQAQDVALKIEIVANQLAAWTRDENRVRAEKLIESTTALANEVDRFLETNRQPFKEALAGVARASEHIATLTGEGETSIKAVRHEVIATLEEARTTIKDARRPLSKLDPDDVAEAVASVRRAADSIDTRISSRELGRAIDDMQVALTGLSRLLEDVDVTVRAGREDFTAALSSIRQAAEDLREFSRVIAQDPSVLLRSKE
ncbi:MAG: MCE family protein [Deltaproteobacteria bacterium]|nr:MCE family protein [Deltaproteobacteria bacterium]